MQTIIYTTRKLEKLIRKRIQPEISEQTGLMGKWNATVFYVNHKKCWLMTNGPTKYNLILPDIRAKDLDNMHVIFRKALYDQMLIDGLNVKADRIASMIGDLIFRPTDNDKVTTGFQNQRLYELAFWIAEYKSLENMPVSKINTYLNKVPIRLRKDGKLHDYTDSLREMKLLLEV